MKKILFFLIIGSLVFSACQSSEQQPSQEELQAQQEQMWDEVMAVHDEVMPKMSEIKKLERELSAYIGEESSLDAEMQEKVGQTVQELSAAAEGMMSWMSNIKQLEPMREEMDHKSIMNYLKEEKTRVEKVKENMVNSIEMGKELMGSLEKE